MIGKTPQGYRCVCALLHFPWPAALQQCAAYAAATGSSDVLLLTNCRQAGAAWSSTDGQLCISNNPETGSESRHFFIFHIISLTPAISWVILPCVYAAFLMIKLSMGVIIAMIRKTIPFYLGCCDSYIPHKRQSRYRFWKKPSESLEGRAHFQTGT